MSSRKQLLAELSKIEAFLNKSHLTESFNKIKEEISYMTETKSKQINVYSDGACRGNPGPGSWACFAKDDQGEILFEKTGVETNTTNNKMEMKGVIEGLREIIAQNKQDLSIEYFTDSKYVVSGLQEWMPNWKRRGWKKADKKTPENVELWKELDALSEKFHGLTLTWVKGHAGHAENEKCDQMANEALDDAGF